MGSYDGALTASQRLSAGVLLLAVAWWVRVRPSVSRGQCGPVFHPFDEFWTARQRWAEQHGLPQDALPAWVIDGDCPFDLSAI